MWSRTVLGSVGIRITEPALYDCGKMIGIGWPGCLNRYVTVILCGPAGLDAIDPHAWSYCPEPRAQSSRRRKSTDTARFFF
jgi:hypothetical protein